MSSSTACKAHEQLDPKHKPRNYVPIFNNKVLFYPELRSKHNEFLKCQSKSSSKDLWNYDYGPKTFTKPQTKNRSSKFDK